MIILWFRQDFRLDDNLALINAVEHAHNTDHPIIPIYIHDDHNADTWKAGGASKWWLHHSLKNLAQSLKDQYGLTLTYFSGAAEDIIERLITNNDITHMFWNRQYEPWRIARDTAIKATLKDKNITAHSYNSAMLYEPHTVAKADGTPYKVFTPYYRKGCLQMVGAPPEPAPAPEKCTLKTASLSCENAIALDDLNFIPSIEWYKTMEAEWNPGEQGALKRWGSFLENGLKGYKEGRNFPDKPNVSRLSPHLHFGEISPRKLWHEAQAASVAQSYENDADTFQSELGWREFSTYLLYHFPELPHENLQEKFNHFPWNDHTENDHLQRWQSGQTGYPIVDAGMRELWQTGYMHNRVRMVVGSFLVKHLRLHWHHGEHWFWDTLLDADLANNSASWQWIAGCGADAAPYFRIFNPITQGKKFDADGAYVRKYVPEIAGLPDKYLHAPWEAPDHILARANVTLGKTYPKPVVDHSAAREDALSAFSSLKASG